MGLYISNYSSRIMIVVPMFASSNITSGLFNRVLFCNMLMFTLRQEIVITILGSICGRVVTPLGDLSCEFKTKVFPSFVLRKSPQEPSWHLWNMTFTLYSRSYDLTSINQSDGSTPIIACIWLPYEQVMTVHKSITISMWDADSLNDDWLRQDEANGLRGGPIGHSNHWSMIHR